jgi:sialic acid synthase
MFSKDAPFFIAEVGQNHQGDLDNALQFIEIFAHAGADAIKFQTRNNKFLFSDDAYNAPYNSENAFKPIYGEHREALELNLEWLPILKEECRKFNVKFMSTPFDEPSLEVLKNLDADILKIASFDLGNLPFINRIAQSQIPVVISVGGGNYSQIDASVKILLEQNVEVAVLHCVSEYPCEYDRLGLENIKKLIAAYPECTIGSSDHFNGILSGPVAFMEGARVFEKHVTLNRSWIGTDHSFALERGGFTNFVRDIKRVPSMMPTKPKDEIGIEPVFMKLGKSLVSNQDIEPGDIFTLENLSGKIFQETFIPVRESNRVIGLKATEGIKKGMPIPVSVLSQ